MKKNIFIIVSLFIISVPYMSAQLKSEVNECFELVSIAFRLADAPEYVNNEIPDYVSAIDTYFSKYKDHELFPYIKGLREKHGISYDAVMCAAAC